MILVDNTPILTLPKEDARRQWYESELKKIKGKKDSIVIKRISTTYRTNKQGFRVRPPLQGIQSRAEYTCDRGREMWACCTTYTENANKSLSLKPNYYFLSTIHQLDPQKDSELIFYFTCIVDILKHGFIIEDKEKEAHEINEKEIAELDVKMAIYRQLEHIDDLRQAAEAWGIPGVHNMGVEELRKTFFEKVKESEKNRESTKKGYKEFLDEIVSPRPEVMEMRQLVNKAIGKNILNIAKVTRKVTYIPTEDFITTIPLEHLGRQTDYLADYFLRPEKTDMANTIRQDVYGEQEEKKWSVADIDNLKTREQLKRTAAALNVPLTPTMKDETIRTRLIEKVQQMV